jgi:hypothetical protein
VELCPFLIGHGGGGERCAGGRHAVFFFLAGHGGEGELDAMFPSSLLVLLGVRIVLAWCGSASSTCSGSTVEAGFAEVAVCSTSGSWFGSFLQRLAVTRSTARLDFKVVGQPSLNF